MADIPGALSPINDIEVAQDAPDTESLWNKVGANINALITIVPTGVIYPYAGTSAPTGYLICDGSSLVRSDFPDLFSVIGTAFGTADGTHFNLPDCRGRFIRGFDNGAGNDPDAGSRTASSAGGNTGDNIGSYQGDVVGSHTHNLTVGNGAGGGVNYPNFSTPLVTTTAPNAIIANSGNETRPKNLSFNFIIKT